MSTYIKLEDVQKILSKTSDKYQSEYTWWWISWKIQEELNSLSSIDFEWMIKKVQDEYWIWNKKIDVLEELLNKLPK